MKILVTAGNTLVPIDRVRCITNIFTGRTGAQIARAAHARGHAVTLLTSHPEALQEIATGDSPAGERWRILRYHSFEDLHAVLEAELSQASCDGVIHSAAVSDYLAAGAFAAAPGTRFQPEDGHWHADAGTPTLIDRSAGKVKSDEPELWLRLVRAPKLVDLIRSTWNFRGVLVKFKLEVGISEERLLDIAERSRKQSDADLMVANTLEGAATWAFLGPRVGGYDRIARRELAGRLLDAVEDLHRERTHG